VKALYVQLQPARSPGLDVAGAVARLSRAGEGLTARVRVTAGVDRGPYVNLAFTAADLPGLWAAVRAELRVDPALAASAIAVCEGDRGLDDYLLLHHFDPAEPLDELE
jgi:hypothetical protein